MLQEMYSIQQLEAEEDRLKSQIEAIKNDEELKRLKAEFHNLKESVEEVEKLLGENKAKQEDCLKQKQKIEKEIKDFNEKNWTDVKVVEDLERKKLHIQKQKEQLPQIDDRRLVYERAYEKLSHDDTELKKKAKFIKEKFEKHKEELKLKIANIEQSLEGIRANLDAIMSIISPELLDQYETLRLKHGTPIAKVVDSKCASCGTEVNEASLNKLGAGDEETTCEGCGRLLMK